MNTALVMFVVFIAITLVITYWASRRTATTAEFYSAGRTITDLVFVLIVAEAAAHAMGAYESVTEGLIVVATLIGWNYLLNVLSFHFKFVERLTSAGPLPIIRDGKLLQKNMTRELLTENELMESLRKEGVEDIENVKVARVEPEGRITVVKKETD